MKRPSREDAPQYLHGYRIPYWMKYLLTLQKFKPTPNDETPVDRGGKVGKKKDWGR